MKSLDLNELLRRNSYPGRGIVFGMSEDSRHAVIAYFIMGRSENSRNRIFEAEGDAIRTKAFRPEKMSDPSLVIYFPVRVLCNQVVVTNGDQTDTIAKFLEEGKTFEEALRTRSFEPDPPIYTPRISGIISLENCKMQYKLSIIKSSGGDPRAVERQFFEYEALSAIGHFIHTYEGDGDPVPSFSGEPVKVKIRGDIDEFTKGLWDSLNEDNKVSLFTRFIDVETGNSESRIINKNH